MLSKVATHYNFSNMGLVGHLNELFKWNSYLNEFTLLNFISKLSMVFSHFDYVYL